MTPSHDTAGEARTRLLDAYEQIMKFEPDPIFAKLAQRRVLELVNPPETRREAA